MKDAMISALTIIVIGLSILAGYHYTEVRDLNAAMRQVESRMDAVMWNMDEHKAKLTVIWKEHESAIARGSVMASRAYFKAESNESQIHDMKRRLDLLPPEPDSFIDMEGD